MGLINIVIADDQTLMREGLRTILELEDDMQVVGMANNGQEAFDLVKKLSPSVVLMDVRMPIMDGVTSTKLIMEQFPKTVVIILTTFDEDDYIIEALACGAKGFLLKDIPGDRLIDAIRGGFNGQMMLPASIGAKLAARLSDVSNLLKRDINFKENNDYPKFSQREKDIILLIIEGLSNRQISETLFLGEGTVKNYISEIYNKIGINNRQQAIIYLRKLFIE
ncbi:response regulator transcription factor [Anaerobacillus isosaccharinicus]|uniref:DNA-binding response regulator n=1 Tax=Anaerobacillus isosaccharinicus TaxID=1532552 RepID=A0A1S2LC35_9BACI|nr:response regulator transcription factor [Anaerobacillus isosaccharinicus]MBA5584912.1 response regulator transcription factor [Anaerobacillus isosaccharinicus]QOY36730.1 response regulator transcription factor [Anaerobacillus isosaccharinicus]